MICTKIIITNFNKKLEKLSFMFFSRIQTKKDVWKKARNWPILNYCCIISNSDSVGVKL